MNKMEPKTCQKCVKLAKTSLELKTPTDTFLNYTITQHIFFNFFLGHRIGKARPSDHFSLEEHT